MGKMLCHLTVMHRLSEHIQNSEHNMRKSKAQYPVPPCIGSQIITEKADNDTETGHNPADCHNPYTSFHLEIRLDQVEASPIVSLPVQAYSPSSDGINQGLLPVELLLSVLFELLSLD